jgi:hypothetical protein
MTQYDFSPRPLYDIYSVTVRFREYLCGGVPKNPDLIKGWIKAKTGFDDKTTEVQTQEALDTLTEEVTEKSWNGFPGDERGLFIWTRQVKALFKECATMLRYTVDKRGSKQIFQHGFEIKSIQPDLKNAHNRLYLGKKEADGFIEGPIHVQTAQGPRSAIKRVDYVEGTELSFEIWVLMTATAETRHIGEKHIVEMLRFGQENGIGADRSQGHGKFDVTSFECTQRAERPKKEKEEGGADAVLAKEAAGAKAKVGDKKPKAAAAE